MPQSMSSQLSNEVKFDEKEKLMVANELSACLIAQRTYGKQGNDLAALVKIFLSDLRGYSGKDVARAIDQWRNSKPEFPTIADIRGILDPQPVFDVTVYRELLEKKKRGDINEYSSGWEYIKAYEKNAMKGI